MASRVKRADTSAIRSAPLVTTTKLITTKIAKTIKPTAKLPPIRKWPKASMTAPAAPGPVWPSSSTTRVDATLRESRINVVKSRTDGNAEKSSGRIMYAATIITIKATAILMVKNRSKTSGGSGSTIMARIATTSIGADAPCIRFELAPNHCCKDLSEVFMSRQPWQFYSADRVLVERRGGSAHQGWGLRRA